MSHVPNYTFKNVWRILVLFDCLSGNKPTVLLSFLARKNDSVLWATLNIVGSVFGFSYFENLLPSFQRYLRHFPISQRVTRNLKISFTLYGVAKWKPNIWIKTYKNLSARRRILVNVVRVVDTPTDRTGWDFVWLTIFHILPLCFQK